MKIIKKNRSRKSLVLFQQLHRISMEEAQHNYMLKQQELIDALTDEMTDLYRTQEATDKKLETLLTLITNNSGNIQEVGRHLQACPRREEMDPLSESMKGWTEKIEKVNRELQNFKEVVEDDDLVIQVKDNILKTLNENYEEIQLQIKELEKFNINHNNTSNVNSGLNVEKAKIKFQFLCSGVLIRNDQSNF